MRGDKALSGGKGNGAGGPKEGIPSTGIIRFLHLTESVLILMYKSEQELITSAEKRRHRTDVVYFIASCSVTSTMAIIQIGVGLCTTTESGICGIMFWIVEYFFGLWKKLWNVEKIVECGIIFPQCGMWTFHIPQSTMWKNIPQSEKGGDS